jgi:glyoxylase-like metal-dependent hydrolase (beta-lactamase superfamily II)
VLPIADRWFDIKRIDDDITLLFEPHVHPFMRCNIWHVRGRDRDLMIDTGMGFASLVEAARHLLDKPVAAVATHTHADHIGGHHEFDSTIVHRHEAANLKAPALEGTMLQAEYGDGGSVRHRIAGYELDGGLITALPHADYDLRTYRILPAKVTEVVEDGAIVDLGDRRFEVLHLPGHSPGSIGLWEQATGILFSGDAIYDGQLLDELPTSDIPTYIRTMRRLRELPVSLVHAGHDPSFGRPRLLELVDSYLAERDR